MTRAHRAHRADRRRRRYAIVGTGHRAEMYVTALSGAYRDAGELIAVCDTNRTRMAYYQRLHADAYGAAGQLPAYGAEEFESMLERERPDAVIVTTKDSTHARYVTSALDRGRDVICEKPLTTDAEGCRAIADAVRRSAGELVVTFNYRYAPRNSEVRRLLMDGAIGRVTSVVFEWVLDTVHGADYFRRWHRRKADSGGLLVHKASHHFDLVNWWLGDVPRAVYALGSRAFYGPDGPVARARRENGAPVGAADPFALDIDRSPRLSALYGKARDEDGYARDRDVFSPGVDIEDNMAALVQYEGGPSLTYALNAHCPWEGYRVAVNGTAGRLELNVCERAAVIPESTRSVLGGTRGPILDPSADPDGGRGAGPGGFAGRRPGTELVVQRHWQAAERVPVPDGGGAHGGGDGRLLDDVFRGREPDPLGRRAGFLDGIRSVLIGAAANRSMATGDVVRIAELGVDLSALTGGDA